MKPFHGNQVIGVGRREPAQLSAGGDTRQCHGVPQAPSIAPSTSNTEKVSTGNTERVSESFWQTFSDHPLPRPRWWCAQPSPLTPISYCPEPHGPAHLHSSPCPPLLCSSPPSCSKFNASFMSFHLTLSSPQKASPLYSGGAAGSVSGRVLGGPSKPQRQQHKGPSQAGLGASCWEEGGLGEAGADLHLLWQAARSTQLLADIQLQPTGMQV